MAALPILAAVSAGFQAVGSIFSGMQQSAASKQQAAILERNAKIQQGNATIASQQANAAEETQRRKARQVLGAQRAAIAQSGIGFDGTTGDVMEQSATNATLDALNIRYEGDLRKRGLLEDANSLKMQAGQARSNAKSAMIGGFLNAGSAALSSYSNYSYQKALLSAKPTA